MLPLKGLTVVSLEQAVAAPYCSSRLADAGARVIKIERDEGDFARHYDSVVNGESAYFVWLNRGKESLCLDIKKSQDAQLLHNIIAKADVFIQNLAPGAASRSGFDSAQLRKQYPRLISVDISGYGEFGPYKDMKAYDLLVQCETGLAGLTGSIDAPGRVGVSVCDIACGMYAHTAVLQALIQRGITGEGQAIKVSLFAAMADWMTVPLLHQEYTGQGPQRLGLNHPSIAPYGAYPYDSGEQVVISIQNNREWVSFCEIVLCLPGLVQDQRFVDNTQRHRFRDQLDEIIVKVFADFDRQQIKQALDGAAIAYGFVNNTEQLSKHPQLTRTTVDTPNGPVSLVAPPTTDGQVLKFKKVPSLGEHSKALREEFSD